MSSQTNRRTNLNRSASRKRSFWNIFKLSGLSPVARRLVFVSILAFIGVAAVNISQAAAITCPLKTKPGFNRGSYLQQRRTHKHAGTDLIVGRQPVYAAVTGTVRARTNFDENGKGYGHFADLHGNDGKVYRYAHLAGPPKSGKVNAGDPIGTVGDSGSPGSTHLHFEVRNSDGFGTPGTHSPNTYLDDCIPSGGGSAAPPPQNSSSSAPAASTTLTPAQVAAIINGPAGYENFQMTLKEKIQMFQHNRKVPNSCSNPRDWRSCDGIVGPATRAELLKVAEEFAGGGPSDDLTDNSPAPPIVVAPQPGQPGQPGTSNCTGGCKPGTPGASNPGTPGASNPGTATQGSPGSPGSPGSRGTSGTSGTSGQQGSRGSQGGVFIGGQSQGSSYSGSTKTSCKSGTCTTTTPDGRTTTTKAASSNNKPPAVAQYVIRSHASGRCMDADGTSRGKDTQIWDCHGGTNQKWGLASDGTIRLAASGLCLEVESGRTKNGSDVQIYTCNGGSHQRWQWNSDGTIRSTATGRCMDVKDNDTDNGTNLQIWDCYRGASNQRWGTW